VRVRERARLMARTPVSLGVWAVLVIVSVGLTLVMHENDEKNRAKLAAAQVVIERNTLATRSLANALREASLDACRRDRVSRLNSNEFATTLRVLLLSGAKARRAHAALPTTAPASRVIDLEAARATEHLVASLHDAEIVDCTKVVPPADTPG